MSCHVVQAKTHYARDETDAMSEVSQLLNATVTRHYWQAIIVHNDRYATLQDGKHTSTVCGLVAAQHQ